MFEKLRHWFTPHHTNNHRAQALHPQAFVFYILLIFVIQVSLKTVRTSFPNVLGFATDISVHTLLDLTNQKRADAGLPPLTLSPLLSSAASGKAADMFSQNYWAHVSPSGKTPWDFIIGSGYHYVYAGENLAKNFNDSKAVIDAWMNSPSHRDNVLKKEYRDVGFAVVNGRLNGEETTLVVEEFGTPTPDFIAQNSANNPAPLVPSTSIPQPSPTASITTIPTPTPILITPLPTIITPVTVGSTDIVNPTQIKVAGASFIPIFNINTVSKLISLSLIGFLLLILGLDSIFIWHRKTVRVSGHNFAHMLFLLALIGVIYLTGTGAII